MRINRTWEWQTNIVIGWFTWKGIIWRWISSPNESIVDLGNDVVVEWVHLIRICMHDDNRDII